MSSKYNKFLFILLILLFIGLALSAPGSFLTSRNMRTLMRQLPEFGLISLGMTVVILTGGINLSITNSAALSGILGAMYLTGEVASGAESYFGIILVTLLIILATGILTGIVNGIFVSYIGVTPILVTIGTMTLFNGISLNLTGGGSISGFPREFYWFAQSQFFNIPMPMIIFIITATLLYILLEKTPWGKKVYFIGSNPKGTKFTGIRVKRILFQVYLLSSFLAAVAGLLMISRYNTARAGLGESYLLQSVAATVLGGNSISGGEGSIMGTILAVGILQLMSNGMNILGISTFIINITMGIVLIMVLIAKYYLNKNDIFNAKAESTA